jgi:hypothetical protein
MDNLHNIHDHPGFLRGLARLRIAPAFTASDDPATACASGASTASCATATGNAA